MVTRSSTSKAGPKAKRTPRPGKPRRPAASSKALPKAAARAKPGTGKARPAVPASRLIDQRIRELGGWRGETLARVRALILEADPEVTEEWKWENPVWSHHGIVCTGEAYQKVVKLTFARGAALPDPKRLFNASLQGNTRRALDLPEGAKVDAGAFQALVKAAVARNGAPAKDQPGATRSKPVKLLTGGNPRIAKADGDAPVQAYLAALPGWKREVAGRIDALIARSVPGVRKAVKWNSPFYGIEGQGWFLAMHAFTRHLKVTFFRGASLRPVPPGPSASQEMAHLDVREGDALDEARLAAWVKQAAALPGWST